ncbi:Pimeloyl-ACP methyl ester carboxylesterase [Virgibacillus subterraneus]|uniref:Pimeloyl-ACP methyl ester carboxylesterase n=1 Tax=Virgibacillus subterraneus TaxID=621109 RepID=A0A1H9JW96_9BACI|nr:alpha/beta hydrolase [Virgibacillus subterraneus]SEQ91082.1 Pimeloyl-ACP methyl ester carboxylesterase [Virgibacillus subterraneus]
MGKYHSVIIGQGKPLIFLPALGFSGNEGLNIAESLAGSYECHLLDLPGLGKSDGLKGRVSMPEIASWVKQYSDQNKLEDVTLIGHSMGGGIAMCFASVYPEYVNRIVLLDQGHLKLPRFPTSEFGLFGYVIPVISLMERLLGDKLIKRIKKFFISDDDNNSSNANTNEKQLREFCERFKLEESDYINKALMEEVPFTGEGLRLMFGYYRLNLPKILQKISHPCLLIYASFKDIDEERARMTDNEVNKINPTSNLKLFKIDSHHYVHWADEKCLDEIREFLGYPQNEILEG